MKRRALLVFLLAAGALLVSRLWVRAPVDVVVSYRFGELARELREVTLRYDHADDGGEARHVVFRYGAEGAPVEVAHRTRLVPGRYRVEIELVLATGTRRTVSRRFEVQGAGEHVTLEVGEPERTRRSTPPTTRCNLS